MEKKWKREADKKAAKKRKTKKGRSAAGTKSQAAEEEEGDGAQEACGEGSGPSDVSGVASHKPPAI